MAASRSTDGPSLAAFIRQNADAIIAEWLELASRLPSAHGLSLLSLRDHVPLMLETLAEAAAREDESALPMKGLPNLHAALRVREGYDLRQVVAEYRALRRAIHAEYSQSDHLPDDVRPQLAQLRLMHAALDAAIGDAVDQYALDREKARETFIGMLGHDLRDPLNAILVGAQLLLIERDGARDPGSLKIATRIAASAKRMQQMICDLLDFARGRLGGGLPVVPTPLDARTLIEHTIDEIAHAHAERDISSRVGDATGDFLVEWDGDRIAQALSNLVGNAVAHGLDPITVEPIDQGQSVSIDVRNRGEIAPEMLPRLFEPFDPPATERRQHSDTPAAIERRRGHLGLGLYIVREVATAHGGTISVKSADGQTTFRLTLPRHVKPSAGLAHRDAKLH
jgi:signal transduction histidine kinase